jgi:K+-sensing histidine kinase KdpD
MRIAPLHDLRALPGDIAHNRTTVRRYAMAVVVTVLALLIALGVQSVTHLRTNLLLVPPVAISAWYGGRGPGIFASVLSVAAIMLTFDPTDRAALDVRGFGEVVYVSTFLVVALIIGGATESLRVERNLLTNALKFTAPRGRVILSAKPLAGEAIFAVSDNGPGIAPGDMAHLFDRFWQARDVDSRGIGLGLTISKGIVEAHGGRIWVESEPGSGSTFSFASPAAPFRAESDCGRPVAGRRADHSVDG